MIVERVTAGLRRAVAQGKRLGRAPADSRTEQAILRERAKGTGMHKVACIVGVGTGRVQRVIARAKA